MLRRRIEKAVIEMIILIFGLTVHQVKINYVHNNRHGHSPLRLHETGRRGEQLAVGVFASEVISDLEPLPLDREFAQPRLPFDERLGHEELARSDTTGEMK